MPIDYRLDAPPEVLATPPRAGITYEAMMDATADGPIMNVESDEAGYFSVQLRGLDHDIVTIEGGTPEPIQPEVLTGVFAALLANRSDLDELRGAKMFFNFQMHRFQPRRTHAGDFRPLILSGEFWEEPNESSATPAAEPEAAETPENKHTLHVEVNIPAEQEMREIDLDIQADYTDANFEALLAVMRHMQEIQVHDDVPLSYTLDRGDDSDEFIYRLEVEGPWFPMAAVVEYLRGLVAEHPDWRIDCNYDRREPRGRLIYDGTWHHLINAYVNTAMPDEQVQKDETCEDLLAGQTDDNVT